MLNHDDQNQLLEGIKNSNASIFWSQSLKNDDLSSNSIPSDDNLEKVKHLKVSFTLFYVSSCSIILCNVALAVIFLFLEEDDYLYNYFQVSGLDNSKLKVNYFLVATIFGSTFTAVVGLWALVLRNKFLCIQFLTFDMLTITSSSILASYFHFNMNCVCWKFTRQTTKG